jgi:hypothetical protein
VHKKRSGQKRGRPRVEASAVSPVYDQVVFKRDERRKSRLANAR